MANVIKFLEGKKTYIVAVLAFVAAGGQALGWWSAEQVRLMNMFLAAFGLAFSGAAASNISNKQK